MSRIFKASTKLLVYTRLSSGGDISTELAIMLSVRINASLGASCDELNGTSDWILREHGGGRYSLQSLHDDDLTNKILDGMIRDGWIETPQHEMESKGVRIDAGEQNG